MSHTDLHRITETSATSKKKADDAAKGQTKPGTNAGGKSEGAKDKILRYPLARIDNSTDYLSIIVQKFTPTAFSGVDSSFLEGVTTQDELRPEDTAVRFGLTGAENVASNIIKGLTPISKRLGNINNLKTAQYHITLPIPNNITDSNSVSWGEDSLNPLQAAGINAIEAVGTTGVSGLSQAMGELLEKVGNVGANEKKAVMAAIAAFGVGSGPEALISRATGQILNPNLELLFSGVNLRTFSFTFDFAPRNAPEAAMVKKIIRAFKKSIVPTGAEGILVKAPSVFQLQYKKGQGPHPFLNSFKPCALVSLDINYTGSGTYATYRDGTPVHMQMSLTFKELNPIYGEDYKETDKNVGY